MRAPTSAEPQNESRGATTAALYTGRDARERCVASAYSRSRRLPSAAFGYKIAQIISGAA